jgi:hypothetical protein
MMAYAHTPTVVDSHLTTADGQRIRLDTRAWFAWLETAISFSYTCQRLEFYRLHLRKRQQRHQCYWYAHLKIDTKLYNTYAGRSADLTAARLEAAGLNLLDKWRSQRIDASST